MKTQNFIYNTLTENEKQAANYLYNYYVNNKNYDLLHLKEYTFIILQNNYDETLTKRSYNKIFKMFENTLNNPNFKYYDGMIQLSENRTLWQINNNKIDSEYYENLVNYYLQLFENETNVKIFQEGRNGRHIVIENNAKNFINYSELQQIQANFENELINQCNKIKPCYTINKNKFMDYVKNTFTINNTTYLLIDSLFNYLSKNNTSYETFYYNDSEIYINIFLHDLINILNDSNIDITINELFKNDILEA